MVISALVPVPDTAMPGPLPLRQNATDMEQTRDPMKAPRGVLRA